MLISKLNKFFFIPEGAEPGNTEPDLPEEEKEIEVPELDNTKEADTIKPDAYEYDPENDSEEDFERKQSSLLEKMSGEEKPSQETQAEPDEGNTEPEEQNNSQDAGNTDEQTGKDVIINADYIKSRPEAEQEILRQALGKREKLNIDSQILKNYVNAQLHIRELKSGKADAENATQAPEEPQKQEPVQQRQLPSQADTPKFSPDKITTEVNKATLEYLKTRYPDMPADALTNEDALDEYTEMMSPLKVTRLLNDIQSTRDHYTREVKEYADKVNNWEDNAGKVIDNALSKINTLFENSFGKKAIEVNPNLSNVDWLVENVIMPNQSKIVTFLDSNKTIPVLNEDALIATITGNPGLFKNVAAQIETKGRQEGYQKRVDSEPPPSQSGSNQRSMYRPDTTPDTVTDETDPELADDIIEKQIRKMKRLEGITD